jgi:hypothetical protein
MFSHVRMSALGHKRTWRLQFAMSALPPKADIRPRDQDVCFGPIGDIRLLFDHLVGARDELHKRLYF